MAVAYVVREGLAGFRRARFAVIASMSTMAVALVLVGLCALLIYQAQQVSSWLRQRVGEMELFLGDIDEQRALALEERTRVMPGVSETEYISQDEAQRIFRDEFGEGAEVFFEEQFLPASIRVRVEPTYANPDSLTVMAERFEAWNRVDEVIFNQALLVAVQRNLRVLTLAGLFLGVLVVLASMFLVANTIRLTIYARRLLIRTLKLVGATDRFIRQPFLVEGIMQGVVAGSLAALVVWGLYGSLASYLPQLATAQSVMTYLLLASLPVAGILLGWLGASFAVRRFIRTVAVN
ncbi:MAG: permease-like cell division protein FtsX [Bacteroidota bacterium]